jgi:hypothetical protein
LNECGTNIERAKLFQMLAFNRPDLTLTNVIDNVALQRVRPALQNPRREVTNIAEILTREFTRLYRKRNMVVHGGQIRGANLHSISETLTPLIGAGIDRIVHAQLQFGVSPIELSAMAEAGVDYLSPTTSNSGGGLLDLLEHPARETTHEPQPRDIQPASSIQVSAGEASAVTASQQTSDCPQALDTSG